jgi:hypothetical protein
VATYTAATFQPHVGDAFTIRFTDGEVELRLVQVHMRARESGKAAGRRVPFALYFVGPAEVVLPQRIYAFEHDTLGVVSLFIVPLGLVADGMRYEAVFN